MAVTRSVRAFASSCALSATRTSLSRALRGDGGARNRILGIMRETEETHRERSNDTAERSNLESSTEGVSKETMFHLRAEKFRSDSRKRTNNEHSRNAVAAFRDEASFSPNNRVSFGTQSRNVTGGLSRFRGKNITRYEIMHSIG